MAFVMNVLKIALYAEAASYGNFQGQILDLSKGSMVRTEVSEDSLVLSSMLPSELCHHFEKGQGFALVSRGVEGPDGTC